MQLSLKIDCREHHLLRALHASGAPCASTLIVEQLDLGDVQVCIGGASGCGGDGAVPDRPDIIFERKTLPDMCASIKDGRYREQRLRLQAARERHGCVLVYVLEGGVADGVPDPLGLAAAAAGLSTTVLHTCVFNLMFKSGVHVVHTRDAPDTARYVSFVFDKRAKQMQTAAAAADVHVPDSMETMQPLPPAHSRRDCCGGIQDALVASGAHAKRGANLTPRTCFLMQLCQVPGVSAKTAATLAARWPSMAALYAELGAQEAAGRVRALCDLPGFGKKSAARFAAFMFAPENA